MGQLKIPNKIKILILQHPQEPGMTIGSAQLAATVLENCQVQVGLSWPNLQKAWGQFTKATDWGVLYFGSGLKGGEKSEFQFVSRKANAMPFPETPIKGLIVLDGTWSQAKTLWWRNAWLLKCKRIILYPKTPSAYGKKRREPKPECVSSIEALALALQHLGMPRKNADKLRESFGDFLKKGEEG